MAELHGLDIEEMTRLADAVDRAAAGIDAVADAASAGADESVRIWVGADADDFRGSWSTTHDPAVRRAGAELRAMAEVIRRNRDEQIVTSDVGTGRGGIGSGGMGRGGPGPGDTGPGAGPAPGSNPTGPGSGGDTWTGAFDVGERSDGRLVGEYETDWALSAAAAGAASYREVPGGFEFDAWFEGRSGFQAQLGGTHTDTLLGHDLTAQGELGVFIGGRGDGSASLAWTEDGYLIDLDAEAFVGAEAYANGTFDYGALGAAGTGFALVGATAGGSYLNEFDGRNIRTDLGAEAFVGAKAGVEGDVTLFGDDVSVGGGVGVSTGLGGGIDGGFAFGLDEIGVELDLGLALGLGFDASIDVSFDPVGVGSGLVDAGGAAVDVGKDATGWISPWW